MARCYEDGNERGFYEMRGVSCLAEEILGFWRLAAGITELLGNVNYRWG